MVNKVKSKSSYQKMANKLPSSIALLLLVMSIINNQSSSARNLGSTTTSRHHNHHHHLHHKHHKITFLIKDVLPVNATKSKPATNKVTSQFPFPKPLGLFPPIGGIPISESDPSVPVPGSSTQTLDSSGIGLFYPARATLQELEYGTLMAIDEDLLGSSGFDDSAQVLGKAQGIFVASSEDGTSHMMAMTASFAKSELKDGLRFFGVHQKDGAESHIAVIGGTGKYDGANGYATIKEVTAEQEHEANKFLLFNVYLS